MLDADERAHAERGGDSVMRFRCHAMAWPAWRRRRMLDAGRQSTLDADARCRADGTRTLKWPALTLMFNADATLVMVKHLNCMVDGTCFMMLTLMPYMPPGDCGKQGAGAA
jgi:hypothetical protein